MKKIAVLIPCYNEELTVGKVIKDFQQVLPEADIYVYDNNSSDRTAEIAASCGAIVRHVPIQGKGFVVRQMFQDIQADCCLMVDGDDTYPAEEAQKLIQPILNNEADMVCGDRLSTTYLHLNKRRFHNFGNLLVCKMIKIFFRSKISDVMTGYRAFSADFVRLCPIMKPGFELETEMTIWAIEKRFRLVEIPIDYRDRPAGSHSKLNTVKDGFRVISTIIRSLRDYRPLFFFGMIAIICFLIAGIAFIPVLITYINTGLVPKFPTLICSVFCSAVGCIMLVCGLILHSVNNHFACLFELMHKRN